MTPKPYPVPVVIVRSQHPDDQPEGRNHDVGAWLAEGVVFAGDLPESAAVVREIAEPLRHAAMGGPLAHYTRGHAGLLMHVGAVEFILVPDGEGWTVAFPRGPRVTLDALVAEVAGLA